MAYYSFFINDDSFLQKGAFCVFMSFYNFGQVSMNLLKMGTFTQ